MCGGSPEIVYARAVDVHGIEAICRTCYPDKNPPQIARLIQENAKLRDLLRWRKWPEEKPKKDGDYLCADSGRIFVAGFADGFWAEDYGTDELLAKVQYWRPIGPLPGGE
jgi:hypothetical protein